MKTFKKHRSQIICSIIFLVVGILIGIVFTNFVNTSQDQNSNLDNQNSDLKIGEYYITSKGEKITIKNPTTYVDEKRNSHMKLTIECENVSKENLQTSSITMFRYTSKDGEIKWGDNNSLDMMNEELRSREIIPGASFSGSIFVSSDAVNILYQSAESGESTSSTKCRWTF